MEVLGSSFDYQGYKGFEEAIRHIQSFNTDDNNNNNNNNQEALHEAALSFRSKFAPAYMASAATKTKASRTNGRKTTRR